METAEADEHPRHPARMDHDAHTSRSRRSHDPALRIRAGRFGWVAIVTGRLAGVVLLGIAVAPERIWPNVLLSAMYFVGLGLAGMLFLAFLYMTSAGWSVCFKRVAEAIASTLPVGAVLVLFSLGGIGVLYEWSHADVVAADPLLQGKAGWLNVPFFVGRSVVYLAVWLLFYRAMVRTSRRQDETGGLKRTARARRCPPASWRRSP